MLTVKPFGCFETLPQILWKFASISHPMKLFHLSHKETSLFRSLDNKNTIREGDPHLTADVEAIALTIRIL
jgi:hypothetical protein